MTLDYAARCLSCEWECSGPKSDSQANKHTRTTNHATLTTGTPTP